MELEGTFPCDQCDRFYSCRKSLNRHIKRIHALSIEEFENESYIDSDIENDIQIEDFDVESEIGENLPISYNNDSLVEYRDSRYINFVLKYMSKPEIPRSYVIDMIKDLSEILNDIVDDECVSSVLKNLPNTEYKIESVLKSMNVYIECRNICIHRAVEPHFDYYNKPVLRHVEHSIKLYPLVKLFSTIFKETSLFDILCNHYESISNAEDNNGLITSMCQSKFFKEIIKKVNSKFRDNPDEVLVLPLCIYIDEFEPNNPLGSRSNYKKVAGIYAKIPCLPELQQSKIYNIYRLGFFHGDDRKRFKTDRVFGPIKDEFNFLCESLLPVNHQKYSYLRLIPCFLLGDNLGINQCFDGSEGFNTDKACRLCFLKREEFEYYFACTTHCLYNRETYENMLGQPNCCFKQRSIFNEMLFLHVAENPIVDPLHDLLEGVCKYVLILVLHILVNKKKYFTVEYLNERILSNFFDGSNSPPLVDIDFKRNGIRMSASELRQFIKYFPILVGRKVPQTSEAWYLFILMRHILAISFSYFIYEKKSSDLLRSIIPLHNKLYSRLYKEYMAVSKSSSCHLPFKFHILTHYPYLMDQIGPLGHVQNLRFESGHQTPKKTVVSTRCSINILQTIIKKLSFQYSHMILNFKELSSIETQFGKKIILLKDVKDSIKQTFNFNCIRDFYCISYIDFNHKKIKPGMALKMDGNGITCRFCLIKYIIKYDNNTHFAMQELETVQFDEFLFCFEVKEKAEFSLILFDSCNLKYVSCMYVMNSRKYLVFNDYFYFENN